MGAWMSTIKLLEIQKSQGNFMSFLSTVVYPQNLLNSISSANQISTNLHGICQPGDHVLIGKGDDVYLPASVSDTLQVGQIKCFCFC